MNVEEFIRRKGYTYEARYVATIRNWRQATDERGLSQEQRTQYNRDFLGMVLDELMPWHRTFVFSTLEVNRFVVVCGVFHALL